MRWQFGGNLQPVRMICEFDWRECPSAVINYVWSEIVTDVVDGLTNESMMWRIIAMLFVCTLLVHTIYSKARWMDESTINRENLNVVGCKVQDLELKVNILTYKMQYGTWPLPRQIRGTGIEAGLRNVKLTLTNSSDRNTWLKHMLLSPAENAACLPCGKLEPRSVRCFTKLVNLETKYMSSEFNREASPPSNKIKSSRSSSEKSIKYQGTSKNNLNIVKTDEKAQIENKENMRIGLRNSTEPVQKEAKNSWSETQVLKYREQQPKILSRQQRSCENHLNITKKCSASTRKFEDINNYSEESEIWTEALDRREKNFLEYDFKKIQPIAKKSQLIDKSPEERVNSTQETLHQVTQKLENLHSVLRIYGSRDCVYSNTHDEARSNKKMAESILEDLKNLGSLPTESESDGKSCGTVLELMDRNAESSVCQSDCNSFSACSNQNSLDTRCNKFLETSKDTKNLLKDSRTTEKNVEISRESHETIKREKINSPNVVSHDCSALKQSPSYKIPLSRYSDGEALESVSAGTEEELLQHSLTSSQAELSNGSEMDEKSIVTLDRETLHFKTSPLTQIKLEKEEAKAEYHREQKSEESEPESNESWPIVKNYFQSKLLDIISEEQSASSSTEKNKNGKHPAAFSKTTFSAQVTEERAGPIEAETKADPQNSKLALVSETSEYFSLSNLKERMLYQDRIVGPAESSSDFTEDELSDKNETALVMQGEDEILQKNISDLVNQSVQNIREYIQVFSKMQNDAIDETKKALKEENLTDPSNLPKNCSSDDSIMHFVNTVAIADSMSEELPRELPEVAIDSLVDLDVELSAEEEEEVSPENCNYKPDFTLKRRPGSISLAEENSEQLSCDTRDSRSIFESALSEAGDDDYPRVIGAEILTSEPSCKELVMDYALESDDDFTDDKLPPDTLNLIQFEEEMELRGGKEDERRAALDSPLTGRTVIRATSSPTSNVETDSTSADHPPSDDAEFEDTENSPNQDCEKKGSPVDIARVEEITDSQISINYRESSQLPIIDDSMETGSESNTWIVENSQAERLEEKRRKVEESLVIECRDSVIRERPTESSEFMENKVQRSDNCAKRPNSGDTVVINKSQDGSIENEEIPRKVNLNSDTSSTYMDASSRELLISSGISLAFDKSTSNPCTKPRGSSSTPLQQRIPWNPPKRGSSLNNTTSARSNKPDQVNLELSKIKSPQSKPTGSQFSGGSNRLRAKNNFSLNRTKDMESSISTPGRRVNKSNSDMPERRSRSYATPRKIEASPRNSATSQPAGPQRISRAHNEREKRKTSPEKLSNSKNSESTKKHEERGNSRKSDISQFIECSEKSAMRLRTGGGTSGSSVTKTSSRSCIPVLRSRRRAKSPMRGPLTMSTSSWRDDTFRTPDSALEDIQAEGSVVRSDENAFLAQSPEAQEILGKNDVKSCESLPESRTVIYVNVVTEQEHSATRVVDPKKFLEYLKDRELKIQSVLEQDIGIEDSLGNSAAPKSCGSPRVLTVVSSAVGGKLSNDVNPRWSLTVDQREIQVSAKPSVIDTSTSISDLPEISTDTRANLGKFEIFQVPKELTKDEYIVLLEALNQDPNLHQLREMHKLCNKLGLGFHE